MCTESCAYFVALFILASYGLAQSCMGGCEVSRERVKMEAHIHIFLLLLPYRYLSSIKRIAWDFQAQMLMDE